VFARRAALKRGAEGEARVAEVLEDQGWTVLDRNWSGGGGELDVVVTRDGRIRFVEVKTRGEDCAVGLESVTPAKQRKLSRAAEAWLECYDGTVHDLAFMVALVEPSGITWIDDAFDAV